MTQLLYIRRQCSLRQLFFFQHALLDSNLYALLLLIILIILAKALQQPGIAALRRRKILVAFIAVASLAHRLIHHADLNLAVLRQRTDEVHLQPVEAVVIAEIKLAPDKLRPLLFLQNLQRQTIFALEVIPMVIF